MRQLRSTTLTSLLALALILATASTAGAKDLDGVLPDPACKTSGEVAGSFKFKAQSERVTVTDRCSNGWGIIVELWWARKAGQKLQLRRACWDRNGANSRSGSCNFSLPDNKTVHFYIADADHNLRGCERQPDGTPPAGDEFQYPVYPTTGAKATGCKRKGHHRYSGHAVS